MRLVVDCTSLKDRITGIERYAKEVTQRLVPLAISMGHTIILLLPKGNCLLDIKDFTSDKILIKFSPFASRLLTEQLWIPSVISRLKPSHCYFPAFPPSPIVFAYKNCKILKTVYDAVMWKLPQTLTWKNKVYMKALETIGIHNYDHIFTISEHALSELTGLFPKIKGEIENAGIGIDYNKFNREYSDDYFADFRRKHCLPNKYLLFIGTLEPRKNLLFLLEVLGRFSALNKNVKLVIAGRFGWGSSEVHNYIHNKNLQKDVQLLGAVPDDELPALYKLATAFVYPSLYEGFGLPVIEAMAAGTPVIASNTSSIPEAGGDAAILLSPTERDAWCGAILDVYSDSGLRQKMKENGFRHASKFDWHHVAKKIFKSIQSV